MNKKNKMQTRHHFFRYLKPLRITFWVLHLYATSLWASISKGAYFLNRNITIEISGKKITIPSGQEVTVIAVSGEQAAIKTVQSDGKAISCMIDSVALQEKNSATEINIHSNDGLFQFHRENILGTSFDLTVVAKSKDEADLVEQAVLVEIDRLRKLLSPYELESEISKLNSTASTPVTISHETMEILQSYETWQKKSKGYCSSNVGTLVSLWKQAEITSQLPDPKLVSEIVLDIQKSALELNDKEGTATRMTSQLINIDSLGKGYCIEKALSSAREKVPGAAGILLNIGGDIFACGSSSLNQTTPWKIGLANPRLPQENAGPITQIFSTNCAIATSASYERYYTINGERYSHILDPKTGYPAKIRQSITVVANDSLTANALTLALSLVGPEEGIALLSEIPGAECLIVDQDGKVIRSKGFTKLENPGMPVDVSHSELLAKEPEESRPSQQPTTAVEIDPETWPKDFLASISFNIAPLSKYPTERPYVAIWVQDAERKLVKHISLWAGKTKFIPELSNWWKVFGERCNSMQAITRASRLPGHYSVLWDGTNQDNRQVPLGDYQIFIETISRNGSHVTEKVLLKCNTDPQTVSFSNNSTLGEATVVYGPKNI